MSTVPELTPVTTPPALTVATPSSSLSQVPPVMSALKVIVASAHTSVAPEIDGTSLTVTITWSVFTQPLPSVPVTSYVVVLVGLTVAGFVAPMPLSQLNEEAPLAVNVTLSPEQIDWSTPALTGGKPFTVIL